MKATIQRKRMKRQAVDHIIQKVLTDKIQTGFSVTLKHMERF